MNKQLKLYIKLYFTIFLLLSLIITTTFSSNMAMVITTSFIWITVVMNFALISNYLLFFNHSQLTSFANKHNLKLLTKLVPNKKTHKIMAIAFIITKWMMIIFGAWFVTRYEQKMQLYASIITILSGYFVFMLTTYSTKIKAAKHAVDSNSS